MSHTHAAAAAAPQVPVGQADSVINLQSVVNVASSQVLNADVKTPLSSVLGVTPGLLRSDEDTDPELVVVVNFSEAVRLRSIKFVATEARTEGDVDASGPRTVKIFRDKPNYTFSDCASETPTETLQLTAKQIAGTEEISLKLAKFTSLHSLTIFVENNQDDTPVTFLNQIEFVGSVMSGTDMKALKAHECC